MFQVQTIIRTEDTTMENHMIDLHCHILPGIDDGAGNIDDSLSLLREQKAQKVKSVVFTPHFNYDKVSINEFEAARENSLRTLTENGEFKKMNISFKVGAEVYFSVSLADNEIGSLCFSDTNYILIELPLEIKPHGLMYTIDNVINRGYIPIIAHVERYAYVSNNPIILYDLINKGCLAHINAEALLNKGKRSSVCLKYIKWGLVQLICSDCHSMKHRPPNLEEAYAFLSRNLGKEYVDWLTGNSEKVFNGELPDLLHIRKPRYLFGSWM